MKGSFSDRNHTISGAFIFLLLGLFTVLSALLILFSVQAYRHTISLTSDHNTERIMHSYIRSAIRAGDRENAVSVQDINGQTVLMISDSDGEDIYCKYIYFYDGYLRELYLEADDEFEAENGEEICQASGFSAELDQSMLSVSLSGVDGKAYPVSMMLYSGM